MAKFCTGLPWRAARRRCARITAVALAIAAIVGEPFARAATYHFSAIGNDLTGNGSLAKPWQSINKFNGLNLNAGDSALFRAGDQFQGSMWLDASDSGATSAGRLINPIKIGSYGAIGATTRAKIIAPQNKEAFVAYNSGGFELSDLEFASGGQSGGVRTNGVRFISDSYANTALKQYEHIRVNNVSSHGFGLSGVELWAHNTVGYADVQITNSEFYDNGHSGVHTGATRASGFFHKNVLVDGVSAHHNPGSPGVTFTGHGIVLAHVDGGVVQRSVAHDNGIQYGHGNVGIWTYQSNKITIQYNEAYGNRGPGGLDGGAFDIDGGVTNSVVQYNRSWDNDGAGLLLAEFSGASVMSKNVFRYNLSINDGRKSYGGITVWGADGSHVAKGAVFHNNTIVVDENVVPDAKGAVWFFGPYHGDVDFVNNAFVALNGAALIAGDTSANRSTFINNSYWTDGAPLVLEDATYATVQQWSTLAVQERLANRFVGIVVDPQFLEDGSYRLSADSPLVDAARDPVGVPWPTWISNLGAQDLAGSELDQGGFSDIGAFEFVQLPAEVIPNDVVDAGDLAIWRSTFGDAGNSNQAPLAGGSADFDFDGDTDGADFLAWQRLLGQIAPALGAAASVPEPGTGVLALGLAGLAFVSRRRGARIARRV